MKQALHIFLKDVRRLWLQIAALMLAIAYFADLDARLPAGNVVNGISTVTIEFIVAAMVWFLIARAVHEESPTGEDQFWLTRPYERGSLLLSKVMMVVCVVGVPLFVADGAILSVQSLPVAGNLGGLVLRQFITAAWLIVPPLTIASVTRSLTEDAMVWVAAIAIAVAGYFPGTSVPDFRAVSEKYPIIIAVALLLAALSRQYFTRGTRVSRALIAAAVLLPVLPFPQTFALAIEGLRNDPATSGISLAAKLESFVGPQPTGYRPFDDHCAQIALSAAGAQPGWRLALLSQQDKFTAAGQTASMAWRPAGGSFDNSTPGIINACLNSSALKGLGADEPLTVRVSVVIAVFGEDPPITRKATLQPFEVPGIGKCRFEDYPGIHDYALSCAAPLWFPKRGRVEVGSVDEWSSGISTAPYPWTPFDLLPGMSPVYKWITLPLDHQIRDAIAMGGPLQFRPETRIALLRREITVSGVRFPL